MLKETIKKTAYAIAPKWVRRIDSHWWMVKQARLMKERCSKCMSLEDIVDEVLGSELFYAEQKRTEILELLKLLQKEKPRRVCEIGARRGGSLILFAQVASPEAKVLSMDVNYSRLQVKINRRFAVASQEVTCLQADSHRPETLEAVKTWLDGEPLDFLFIDGDHSFSGVEKDFQMYAPLLRAGGSIALHDIVPDFYTRFGIRTTSDVGQVPLFWNQLKLGEYETEELVEDVNQDGMGIGIVKWLGGKK